MSAPDRENLDLDAFLSASPAQIFQRWVDGEGHAEMTGAAASSDPRPGGAFTAWDGYIRGQHVALEPPDRIVQRWRTAEFPADAGDSLVEITLQPEGSGTRLRLVHTEIPAGQGERYRGGWERFYFQPMRAFFGVSAPLTSP